MPDPRGEEFERFDSRPAELQEPPYGLYRHRPVVPERIHMGPAPQQIEVRPAWQMREMPYDLDRRRPAVPQPVIPKRQQKDGACPEVIPPPQPTPMSPTSGNTSMRGQSVVVEG